MIMAFALSFLVLLVWAYTTSQRQGSAPKEAVTEREEVARAPERARPAPVERPRSTMREPGKVEREISPSKKADVREIEVDTPLYRAVISNAGPTLISFKLKDYRATADPESPLVELVDLGENRNDFFKIEFDHRSNPVVEEIIYQTEVDSLRLDPASRPRDLVFRGITADGISINQTFRFYADKYPIDLQIRLSNNTGEAIEGNLRTYLNNFAPEKKKSYYSFIGVSLLLNDELEKIAPKKMKETKILAGRIDWMAYEQDYFMAAIVSENQGRSSFQGLWQPSGMVEAIHTSSPIPLRVNEESDASYTLYFGPRDISFLKPLEKKLDLAINFGWFDIIAKPLLYALRFFQGYVKNYGIAIILLTIVIKIIFWPLTHKSYKSMKEMQKLQPLMAKIREKYKNNKEQMNRELMGLYKTYKVNPMGGCLPMVIQMPVFFALFRILGSSIELRHAPFFLWISDLSAPDRLFNFQFQVPFMSPPYGIPVLTLLMGASMFLQQKMTPTPGDPSQAKIMMFLPIVFTFMFINFPSGLVLYWFTNNILSIGQQYRIKKS